MTPPEKSCGDPNAELGTCPYAADVCNREKVCLCCKACRRECAMDI